MKARRDGLHRDPGIQIAQDFADRRPGIENDRRSAFAFDRRPRTSQARRVGRALELGRGLALVGHLRPDAAESRDGVEQAAGTGRHRRPGARLDDSAHRLPLGRVHLVAKSVRNRRELVVHGVREPRRRHPPGLLNRTIAAGQADGHQHAGTLESREVAGEELAAPHGRVLAVAGAVEDHTQGRTRLAVLSKARREVRVVVLDADELQLGIVVRPLHRVPRREVVRVEVVRDDARLDREKSLEVLDALAERATASRSS